MRLPLTEAETAQARQLATDLGLDPDAVIADGEAAKGEGYARAHAAAAETMSRINGAGLSAYGGGPAAEAEAG
jgi:hypothetical protein